MVEFAVFGVIALMLFTIGLLILAVLFSKKIVWISKFVKNKKEENKSNKEE